MQINRYTIWAFLFLALCMFVSACKPEDQTVKSAQERHRAAMKDLGKNDYVPVRSPWGDVLDKKD